MMAHRKEILIFGIIVRPVLIWESVRTTLFSQSADLTL